MPPSSTIDRIPVSSSKRSGTITVTSGQKLITFIENNVQPGEINPRELFADIVSKIIINYSIELPKRILKLEVWKKNNILPWKIFDGFYKQVENTQSYVLKNEKRSTHTSYLRALEEYGEKASHSALVSVINSLFRLPGLRIKYTAKVPPVKKG